MPVNPYETILINSNEIVAHPTVNRGLIRLFQNVAALETVVNNYDTLIQDASLYAPTSGEKEALVGSYGTPGTNNVYVTETDPLMLTADERAAITNASTPDGTNPFATMDDVTQQIKAWVTFDGDDGGTPSILDSNNVDSITDNGTGNYTINFTDAFANNDYAVSVSGKRTTTGALGYVLGHEISSIANGAVTIITYNLYPDGGVGPGVSGGITDSDYVAVMAVGNV